MDVAVAIAAAHKGEVTGLYVEEPFDAILLELAPHDEPVIHRGIRSRFRKMVSGIEERSPVPVEGVMRSGQSGRVILEFAKEWNAALVLVGTQGQGFFERMLVGSTFLHLLRHGDQATLFMPRLGEGGD
jgi:nucleotide-binding universal stress UspA family protein